MAPNGSCFMVTWTNFKNNLSEVGLTQDLQTVALQTFKAVGLCDSIMCEKTCMNRVSLKYIAFG